MSHELRILEERAKNLNGEYTIVGPNHIDEDECEYIATVCGGLGSMDEGASRKFAELFVRSPAMLELLMEVADMDEHEGIKSSLLEKIDYLINELYPQAQKDN